MSPDKLKEQNWRLRWGVIEQLSTHKGFHVSASLWLAFGMMVAGVPRAVSLPQNRNSYIQRW